jgi:hypothetical protein
MRQLQLLQCDQPLWQQLQYAAAAAAVAAAVGQPLLVLDHWKLLPQVLAAAEEEFGVLGGTGGDWQWVLLQADTLFTSSSNGSAAADSELLVAVQEVLLAGRSVCLQLHSSSVHNAAALLQAVAACRSMLQLAAECNARSSSSEATVPLLIILQGRSSSSKGKPARSRRGTRTLADQGLTRKGSAAAGIHAAAAASSAGGALGSLPSIVIHVSSSSSVELPAELAGSCMVVDLRDKTCQQQQQQHMQRQQQRQQTDAQAEQQQRQSQQPLVQAAFKVHGSSSSSSSSSSTYLLEAVLRLVLQAADPNAVAAAAAATEEAEDATQQAQAAEGLMIARLSQVSCLQYTHLPGVVKRYQTQLQCTRLLIRAVCSSRACLSDIAPTYA